MSLTDDWKAGKLNEKSIWWADLGNEKIEPARVDEYGYLFGLDGCFYSPERCEYVKILAPCDYDHFVELTEKVKELRQLLKEVKEKIHNEFINQDIVSIDKFNKILTRITEVLNDNKF